jgi:hypothetical protein
MPKGIFLAWSNPVSDDVDEKFNQWYDETHTRDVLTLPGVRSCTRFRLADTQLMPDDDAMGYRYLACYEMEVDDWAEFASALQTAAAEGRVTVDENVLSMDPVPKTMLLEQVGEPIRP